MKNVAAYVETTHEVQENETTELLISENDSVVLKAKDLRDEMRLEILLNQDNSLWVTNLSSEKIRPQVISHRRQAKKLLPFEIVKIKSGDCMCLLGRVVKFDIKGKKLLIHPIEKKVIWFFRALKSSCCSRITRQKID